MEKESLKIKMLNKINSNPTEVMEVINHLNKQGKCYAIIMNDLYVECFRKTKKGAENYCTKPVNQWYDDYTQDMTTNYVDWIEISSSELKNYQTDSFAWYEFLKNNHRLVDHYTIEQFRLYYVDPFNVTEEVENYLNTELERFFDGFVPNKPNCKPVDNDNESLINNENEADAECVGFSEKIDCKIVFNEEKNGIELHFSSKPNDFILMKLKEQGFRWSKYGKFWYTKKSEKAVMFANSLVEHNESVGTLPEVKLIDDIENYKIDDKLSKQENDSNWIFRTKPINHQQDLQNLYRSLFDRITVIFPNLSDSQKLKLVKDFDYFKKHYHQSIIKQLNIKINNPNWAVTGRSGRNMDKYNKAMERLHNEEMKGLNLYKIIDDKIKRYER